MLNNETTKLHPIKRDCYRDNDDKSYNYKIIISNNLLQSPKKITKVQLRDYYRAQNDQSNIDEKVTKVQLRDYF